MFKPVREVAFSRLANEGAHRGEILHGASIEELFQNDPAEFFAVIIVLTATSLRRTTPCLEGGCQLSPGEAHAADR